MRDYYPKYSEVPKDVYEQVKAAVLMRGKYDGKVYEDFDPVKAFWSYDYFNYPHIRADKNDEGPVRKTWTRFRFSFAGIITKRLNIF